MTKEFIDTHDSVARFPISVITPMDARMEASEKQDYKIAIGKRLKDLRLGRGLKQKNLAEMLDRTEQAIGKWERGESLPDYDKLPALAALYQVTTDWILTGKDSIPTGFSESISRFVPKEQPESDVVPMTEVAAQTASLISSVYRQLNIEIDVCDITIAAIEMANDLPSVKTWAELQPLLQAEGRALRRFLEMQKKTKEPRPYRKYI